MTDKTIDLDQHRGMAAQKATDQRREQAEVEADQTTLRRRQDEIEDRMLAAPAETWAQAAAKARYLLKLMAAEADGGDSRRRKLVEAVLADFDRLGA
jgi:hypothetical protein